MAITLEWVRDHYDAISAGGNGNRIIDISELQKAENDWGAATIADQEYIAVLNAYHDKTLLPAYGTPTTVTCTGATPHYLSGCALLLHYDPDSDGEIDPEDYSAAIMDERGGLITAEEMVFVRKVYREYGGSINAVCPGCYTGTPAQVCTPGETRCYSDAVVETCKPDGMGWTRSVCYSGTICKDGKCVPVSTTPVCTPGDERCRNSSTIERCKTDGSGWYDVLTCGTGYECKNGECVLTSTPPPNMETRTVLLTEGSHTIQVSFTGYDTLNATINVSPTGVTCVSVIGGACGGSSLPRASTSGWTVTTYLKSAAAATNKCTWIATKDTSKVAFISEMVLAYNNLANIGFTPSASEIGQAVLMYAKLGTPASLWGC